MAMVKKCKARRRLCWVWGSSGGTIQVGGSHIGRVAACREMEIHYNKAGRGGKGDLRGSRPSP